MSASTMTMEKANQIAQARIAELEQANEIWRADFAKLEAQNRRLLTAIERHRENISLARQADGEHGAHWLNEGAVREWRADNKYLSEALELFMDDETLEGE